MFCGRNVESYAELKREMASRRTEQSADEFNNISIVYPPIYRAKIRL